MKHVRFLRADAKMTQARMSSSPKVEAQGKENKVYTALFLHFLPEVTECSFNYTSMKQEDKHTFLHCPCISLQADEIDGQVECFTAMFYCRFNRYACQNSHLTIFPLLHANIFVLQNFMLKQQKLSTDYFLCLKMSN